MTEEELSRECQNDDFWRGYEAGRDDRNRLAARIAALEAALKPFAECSHEFDDEGNEQPIWYGTVGDLRAARAAMEK